MSVSIDKKVKAGDLVDLVGEDGRRIVRSVTVPAAQETATRVLAHSDEELRIVPQSAFVLVPEAEDTEPETGDA